MTLRDLEYSDIKNYLKNLLSKQDEFTDYRFRGSASDIQLSLLSNVLQEDAFLASLLSSESSLTSSVLRKNIVLNAADLGYTPLSEKAAQVTVDVSFTNANAVFLSGETYYIPKGTVFRSRDDDQVSIGFTNPKTYSVSVPSTRNFITFRDIELVQGTYGSVEYVYDKFDKNYRIILPSSHIDTSLLEVYVEEDGGYVQYSYADREIDLDANSRVYYLREGDKGKFNIFFGDDILGKSVAQGAKVRVVYLETIGKAGNGFQTLEAHRFVGAPNEIITSSSITTAHDRSHGGADPESDESIKANAIRFRAGGEVGYRSEILAAIILKKYRDIRSVNVWGGQTINAPDTKFGRIMVSLNPYEDIGLSDDRIDQIITDLQRDHAVSGLQIVEHVSPDFLYVIPDMSIKVKSTSRFDEDELKTKVLAKIKDWGLTNLEVFNGSFPYSKFSTFIDGIDPIIQGNFVDVRISYHLMPEYGVRRAYTFGFQNTLTPETITTSIFMFNGSESRLKDDGEGNLLIYLEDLGQFISTVVGTVDYGTGDISLNPLTIQSTLDLAYIRFEAIPVDYDVSVAHNYVIRMDSSISSYKVKLI